MVNPSIRPEENNLIIQQQEQIMEIEDVRICSKEGSEYEQSREERIKENRERMQKLGIVDLSLKLNAALKPTPKRRAFHRKTPPPQTDTPLPTTGPIRRSSRLQNSTPVSYCEVVHVAKKDKSLNEDDLLREEGSRPEVYTEEHEKLLGSTEMGWTLFVDGCGKDGKRIYDPVKGKTCHQCRQKTLGHRTHCCECNMVQGQFCGDCLYMRYGENVLEANANPNWICPVCRGICNCSLCRQAKGWPPTGALYRKISRLGYKSVAHYLIQTRRSNTESDKDIGTNAPISVKRSLPFSEIEVMQGEDDLSKSNNENLNSDPVYEVGKEFGDSKMVLETGGEPLSIATPSKDQFEYPLKPESEKSCSENKNEKEDNFLVDSELDKAATESQNESSNYDKGLMLSETLERGNDNEITKEDNNGFVEHETSPISTKKRVRVERTTPDSIAGRLKMRRRA
ncbi:hypothetical protein BUALT_Bualt04G0120700 [Buddleja alternifolia]|uniref:Zinc-finger domain-containing protein n=1 Tax=Buddleja alternifolia TaxID=168488 RepID=A0AAV6XV24_9LAMI|nr:hypothetical protein BUALT_Bualt04G0120700 [Buddleja alternifolia]